MTIIRRMLLLCLFAALLCSAAFTETAIIDLENTENSENFLGFCKLPDGRVLFAGFREGSYPGEGGDEDSKARLLCLNTDMTVSWEYLDKTNDGFTDVAVTKDNTIAALYDGGVRFFTLDGEPLDKRLYLQPTLGFYDVTPLGVMACHRTGDNELANYLELLDWNGSVLFRVDEPESMWVGSGPIEEEDSLVLFGQAAGEPTEAPAKVVKIDSKGSKVWETLLPFLSEEREQTGITAGTKTSDGGYLGILWDCVAVPGKETMESHYTLVKFDAEGNVAWSRTPDYDTWLAVEYNGKYVIQGWDYDHEANQGIYVYQWYDTEGNDLGKTEYRLREEDLPNHVDRDNWDASVENLIPMEKGLWQRFVFWELDDDEVAPASFAQDTVLAPVPEL